MESIHRWIPMAFGTWLVLNIWETFSTLSVFWVWHSKNEEIQSEKWKVWKLFISFFFEIFLVMVIVPPGLIDWIMDEKSWPFNFVQFDENWSHSADFLDFQEFVNFAWFKPSSPDESTGDSLPFKAEDDFSSANSLLPAFFKPHRILSGLAMELICDNNSFSFMEPDWLEDFYLKMKEEE